MSIYLFVRVYRVSIIVRYLFLCPIGRLNTRALNKLTPKPPSTAGLRRHIFRLCLSPCRDLKLSDKLISVNSTALGFIRLFMVEESM